MPSVHNTIYAEHGTRDIDDPSDEAIEGRSRKWKIISSDRFLREPDASNPLDEVISTNADLTIVFEFGIMTCQATDSERTIMSIEFKRGRKKATSYGVNRIFDSRCGSYRIVHSQITLGENRGDTYADRWFAIVMHGDNHEHLISRHRKRNATEKAIAKHARKATQLLIRN